MRQLSNLTKVMFCIVAVLLVITVGLGIATAIKDGKEGKPQQGTEGNGSPTPSISPTTGAVITGEPQEGQEGQTTPAPEGEITPEATLTPTPIPVAAAHKIALDPGQQSKADSTKEPIGPGATATTAKMTYGATSITTEKREHAWNLAISLKIKTELEARGYEVYMTRETADVEISNADRAVAANESGADIYVSIQADAADSATANGIYAQIPTKNNAFVGYMYDDCKALANALQTALITATGANDRGLMETDTVAALNWSKIPVTVLQLGYMTNRDEDTKLQSADYQDKLVKAICDGIDDYFKGLE